MSRVQQIKDLFLGHGWDGNHIGEEIDRELERILQIGPTGEAPIVADPHDQGGLCASLEVEETGTLKLDFGKSLSFLRMTPDEAIIFGSAMLQRGQAVKKELAGE